MAFDMQDDFDSDAKEIEQFGIWVKKAPEDVIETPSNDISQNDSVFPEADDSFNSNEELDSTSFISDLPDPDSMGISDSPAELNTLDNIEPAVEETNLDAIEDEQSFDNSNEENISDETVSETNSSIEETEKTKDEQTSFSAPVSHENPASFQDFQEEDSAENWEPLDDAPDFNYPSVDNITVPPLEEPTDLEIEPSLMEAENDAAEEKKEDSSDFIDLTEDSSFDEIEKTESDVPFETAEDDSSVSFDDEKVDFTEDNFDLPDFGSTPETENFGTDVQDENTESSADFSDEITEESFDISDFGSTPETENFGITSSQDENVDSAPSFADDIPEDDLQESSFEPTFENSEETESFANLPNEEAADNIESDNSAENSIEDTPISDELPAMGLEEPSADVEDDFDSMFASDTTETPSEPAPAAETTNEADIMPEFDAEAAAAEFENMAADTNSENPAENNEAPQDEAGEVELSLDDFMSSDGEVDVSSEFGISSGDSSDVTDDFLSDLNAEFGASSEEKSDLLNEDPVDIDLEFDDQFVSDVQTDASDRIEDESNFDELFGDNADSEAPAEEDNFDDMFAAIQDESKTAGQGAQNSSAPTTEFDEVTEFDDFLSSDSGPNVEEEKKHEKRPTQQVDYNITVSQEDANTTKAPTVETSDDFEASESIPLYGTETDANNNKVAFIPDSEDEPRKAALEKSEDDDFYENLLAGAENIGDTSAEADTSKEGMPPFKESSSADEDLSPTTQTEEQTMKDNFDIDINDENVQNTETEALTEEQNDAFDIPIIEGIPLNADTENISENAGIISDSADDALSLSEDNVTLDDVSLSDDNADNLDENNDIEAATDDFDMPTIEEDDSFDTSLNIDDTLDEPALPDTELDNNEETAEEPIEEATDEHIEIPSLSEDDEDFVDAAALADKLAEDDKLAIENPESDDSFDTSLELEDSLEEPTLPDLDTEMDNAEETAEEEPAEESVDEHIEIPSLSEDDEDFVDAAALADKLAEDDKLAIENPESDDSFDTSLELEDSLDEPALPDLDNLEETAEEEPAEESIDEHIEIPSLSEDDEDFVDAAALADKLAEEDKLAIENSESDDSFDTSLVLDEDLSEPSLEPADETPAFDDITASDDISDNNLPSFDDITSEAGEKPDQADISEEINTNLSDTDNSDEECEISDSSLYNSIISNAFADAPEADENKTDNNLLDIADKSEYTDNKEDEHNMDFDETLQDSGMTEQSAKGVPGPTSNISEAVLKEISNELSMLRSEISQLKEELSNVRHGTFSSQENEVADEPTSIEVDEEPVLEEESELAEAPSTSTSESTGFFDGDIENETIALSGDELSNILNTADFTEEYVDNTSEGDSQNGLMDDEVPTAPTMNFEDENLEEPGDLEVDVQALSDINSEEEISVPKVDDLVVDSGDSFVESTEPETGDSISNDTLKYLEEEPKADEIYDAPANSSESEVVPEMVEADSQDAPVEETEEITLSNEEEVDETPTEAVFEGDQWKEETVNEDAAADDVESVRKKAEQFAESDQKDLKDEIKAVLLYMDQLLENLPDEKIEEFAQSSYFETYKKLFKELGIS